MMTDAQDLFGPAPVVNAETQPFWDAAAEGRLLIKRCRACGEAHYYPRAYCPFCGSDETDWEQAKGTGTLYSVSVMRRGPRAPFAIGYVTLDEGPAVLTRLVACDIEALSIGGRMTVCFRPTDGGPPVPAFTALTV